MKKSLFDSLFSSESYVFYHQNPSSLNKYLLWLYIVEKQGFGAAPRSIWDLFQVEFKCRKLVFHSFQNPSMRTHACICVCMHEARVRRARACMHIRMYAYTPPRVFVTFLFPKQFISSKNKLYFPQTHSLSQFSSDWALNRLWTLKFKHHWGTGPQVIRSIECGIYISRLDLSL